MNMFTMNATYHKVTNLFLYENRSINILNKIIDVNFDITRRPIYLNPDYYSTNYYKTLKEYINVIEYKLKKELNIEKVKLYYKDGAIEKSYNLGFTKFYLIQTQEDFNIFIYNIVFTFISFILVNDSLYYRNIMQGDPLFSYTKSNKNEFYGSIFRCDDNEYSILNNILKKYNYIIDNDCIGEQQYYFSGNYIESY